MEMMDLEQLASYLSRDVREVNKLASRGHLPGRRVNGEWRFARAEINHWLEGHLQSWSAEELQAFEAAHARDDDDLLFPDLLCETTVAVPLGAATRSSVLREIVKLAENSWKVYDRDAILDAITLREEMASTATAGGVAVPHAHRPLGDGVLGEPLIAFGKTSRAIPFGGPKGQMTDLFFLVLSKDDRSHLRVMARLARLFRRDGFLAELRSTETPYEAYELLTSAERELLDD